MRTRSSWKTRLIRTGTLTCEAPPEDELAPHGRGSQMRGAGPPS